MTQEDRIVVSDLGGHIPIDEAVLERIARREIASLAGLFERRLQEYTPHDEALHALRAIWGEVLRDFSQTEDEPGGTREEVI